MNLPTEGLHADALATLRAWTAPTPEQESLRQRYVAHLEAHADGMTRGCYPDHVTASTLVVSADLGEVLLTLHAKARQWFQLGGHCEDGDDTLVAAAMREATEESGLTDLRLDPVPVHLHDHEVPFCDPRGGIHHLDVRFLAVAAPGAAHVASAESLQLAWFPVESLPNPDLDDLVRHVLARLAAEPGSQVH
mgnify:FL=1